MICVCQIRGCGMLGLCFVLSAYLFYQLCPASHNICVKFCVKVFLCPTVGYLYIQSCSLYIVMWLYNLVDRRRNNA